MIRKLLGNACLFLGTVAFFAVLVELVLRFAYPVYESAASSQYESDNLRIWAPRPGRAALLPNPDTAVRHLVIQNDLALRQSRDVQDLATATNLAFFGDSYTANNGLPAPDVFTEPLDYLLNRAGGRFQVLNFGVNGYGTDQAYLYYRDFPQHQRLGHVFYVLCANDLRNIYESHIYSLDAQGGLVINPIPKPAWWVRPVSHLHVTYLFLDLKQRLVHARVGDPNEHREAFQQSAMQRQQKARFRDNRALQLEASLIRRQQNPDLDRTIRIFQLVMQQWRDSVEASGGKFYVVLLPTGREEIFRSFLDPSYRVISLKDLFAARNGGQFTWDSIRFRHDGHWAEEGNRLAALALYQELAHDLGMPQESPEILDSALVKYYSAFPGGWMPKGSAQQAMASAAERSAIRDRYIPLELARK